jgi:hypothetical protein
MSENIKPVNVREHETESQTKKIALSIVIHTRTGSQPIGVEVPSTVTPQRLAESIVRSYGASTSNIIQITDSQGRNLSEPLYRNQTFDELGIQSGETLEILTDVHQGACSIERKGYQGWLQRNYEDLLDFKEKYDDYVEVTPSEDYKSFTMVIKGKGKFANSKLKILCSYPSPAQPPSYKILNREELEHLDHPHIKAIYVCIGAGWTPSTPITAPLEAITTTWWYPLEAS